MLALTYVADADIVVREMCRILKAGGRAVIVDLLPHDREDFAREMGQTRLGFDPKELESLLAAARLRIDPNPAATTRAQCQGAGAVAGRRRRDRERILFRAEHKFAHKVSLYTRAVFMTIRARS